jgi:energy-coupling factor transporter transmembrane protein EcfT
MHSGFLLLLWLIAVAVVQVVPTGLLPGLAVIFIAIAVFFARDRCVRLLRRIRVLLIAIVVLFAWFTPGEAQVADWPRLSPTREGLGLAMEHAARLIAVVSSVAVLLELLAPDRLVSGLYALCRPLAALGLSAERLALRLLLVLRYIEPSDGEQAGNWRAWLLAGDSPQGTVPVHLTRERLGVLEFALALAMTCALLWWIVR